MGKKRANQPGYKKSKDSRGRTIWVPDGTQNAAASGAASGAPKNDFMTRYDPDLTVDPHLLDLYNIPYDKRGINVDAWAAQYDAKIDEDGELVNSKGERAVAYSKGYGAGWSTWNSIKATDGVANLTILSMMDEDDYNSDLYHNFNSVYNEATHGEHQNNEYTGGLMNIVVKWYDKDKKLRILEFDGDETIEFMDEARGWF